MKGSLLVLAALTLVAAVAGPASAGVDVYAGAGGACVAAGTGVLVDLNSGYCDSAGGLSLIPALGEAAFIIVGANVDGNDVCVIIDDDGEPSLDCTGPVCVLVAVQCEILRISDVVAQRVGAQTLS